MGPVEWQPSATRVAAGVHAWGHEELHFFTVVVSTP